MARAKCKYCGSWINTKEAIQINDGEKNRYYCNALCCTKHSEDIIEKAKVKAEYDEIFEITKDIFGYEFNGYSLLKREISAWEKLTTRDKIIAYLKENKEWLTTTMNKEFNGDYNRVRYYSVVVSSKLHDYNPKVQENVKVQLKVQSTVVEEQYETKYKPKARKALLDFEEDCDVE